MTTGDPSPDRRIYYRNNATGERGYLVQRFGADHMKWDQPAHDRTVPFKPDEWTAEEQRRQMNPHEIAQVAYAADQRLCRALGKRIPPEWLTLRDEERVRWVSEGPRVSASSKRARVWCAIVKALMDGDSNGTAPTS